MTLTSKSNFLPTRLLRGLLPVVATVCLFFASFSCANAQLSARKLIESAVNDYGPQYQDVEKAVELFRKRDFAAAQKALEAAKKKNPKLAPANVMYAQLMFSVGQVRAGRSILEKMIEEDPQDPDAYIMLGDLALRQRRLTEAEQMFEKGKSYCKTFKQNQLRKQKIQINAYAGLAAVSESRRNWKQAIERLKLWIEAAPENVNARIRMGQALFQDDRAKEAYTSFKAARQLDEKAPLPEISIALLNQQKGDTKAARKFMDLAVEKAPKDFGTRMAVGNWALKSGLNELALANAKAASEIESDNLMAQLLIGLVARYSGDDMAAIAAFDKVLLQSPRNYAAMNQMALTLVDSKNEKDRIRALGYALINVQINFNLKAASGREALVTFSWVQFQLGNEQVAQRQMKSLLNAGSISSESAYYAAVIFKSGGRGDVAQVLLQKALVGEKAFPKRADAEKMLIELNETVKKK